MKTYTMAQLQIYDKEAYRKAFDYIHRITGIEDELDAMNTADTYGITFTAEGKPANI